MEEDATMVSAIREVIVPSLALNEAGVSTVLRPNDSPRPSASDGEAWG